MQATGFADRGYESEWNTPMPTSEDIAAQQQLLDTHRKTLHVLLTQQAQFGSAYTPPAIIHGIQAARAAIHDIKNTLRLWGAPAEDRPDELAQGVGFQAELAGSPAMPSAGGDLIIANIGAGAHGVAVGKSIQQTITTINPTPNEEKGTLEAMLLQLEQAAATSSAAAANKQMVQFQLRLLAGELQKIAPTVPSANTIMQVVDGVLTTMPDLKALLQQLFALPATTRVLARADAPLEQWLRTRLG
jgi:hypothetical protein